MLETRNPVRIAGGQIDCELNHPVWGWVAFTADPNDPEAHGREIWTNLNAVLPPYQGE